MGGRNLHAGMCLGEEGEQRGEGREQWRPKLSKPILRRGLGVPKLMGLEICCSLKHRMQGLS